jgi:hypothetical protein
VNLLWTANFFLSRSTSLDITNHFTISQETSLLSFPSHHGTVTDFQTKRARCVLAIVLNTGKLQCRILDKRVQHLEYMLYRDDVDHQDVMTCIVAAGVQIQYKGMYPTKTWRDTVLYWICAVSMSGKWPLCSPSTHPSTDRICSLLSPSELAILRWVSLASPLRIK